MKKEEAINIILNELQSAENKWPGWPVDPIHAAGVLIEEAGETMQACLDYSYSEGDIQCIIDEAKQTGAMAIRLLINIKNYKRIKSYQER